MPSSTPKQISSNARWSPYDKGHTRSRSGTSAKSRSRSSVTKVWKEPINAGAIRSRMADKEYNGLSGAIIKNAIVNPFLGPIPTDNRIRYNTSVQDKIVTAEKLGVLDTKLSSNWLSPEKTGDVAANVIYAIKHKLEDDDINAYIIPSNVKLEEQRARLRKRQQDRVKEMQRKTGNFFEQGIAATRALYNVDEFDLATSEQRAEIWQTIWDSGPKLITEYMLDASKVSLDLETIFMTGVKDDVRAGWRAAFKTLFESMCNQWCHHLPGGPECYSQRGRLLWYEDWRTFPNDQTFLASFPWWKFANVPVQPFAGRSSRRDNYTYHDDMSADFAL